MDSTRSLWARLASLAIVAIAVAPPLLATPGDGGGGCPVKLEEHPFPAIKIERAVAGFTDGGYAQTGLRKPGPIPLGIFATDVDCLLVKCAGSCTLVFYGLWENAHWSMSTPVGAAGTFLTTAADEVYSVPDHMRVLYLPPSDLAVNTTRVCKVRATADDNECGADDPEVWVEFTVTVRRTANGLFDVSVAIGTPTTVDIDPPICEKNPDALCDLLMNLQPPPAPTVTINSYPIQGMLVSEYRPLNCKPFDNDRLVYECGTPPGTQPVIHNGGMKEICDDISYAWSIVGVVGNNGAGFFLDPTSRAPLFYASKPGLITVRVDINAGGETAFNEVTFEIFKPKLKQMAFDTPLRIQRDGPIQDYDPPHWKDGNDNGLATDVGVNDRRFPVAFTVGKVLKVKDLALTAQVKPMPGLMLTGADHNYAETFFAVGLQYAAGSATGNWTCPAVETVGTPHPFGGYFPYKVEWYSHFAGSALMESLGRTDNRLYFIFGAPDGTAAGRLHTTFEVACRLNDGAPDSTTAVDRLWQVFQTRSITKPTPDGFNNPVSQVPLKYWGNPSIPNFEASALVTTGDGRCGAWARFMLSCVALQGGAATEVVIKPPAGADARLYVNNWAPVGTPPFLASLYKPGNGNDLPGISAQNNGDPWSRFEDHAAVRIGTRLYDPSYGKGPFNGWPAAAQIAWEAGALFGWSVDINSTTPNLRVNTANTDLIYY